MNQSQEETLSRCSKMTVRKRQRWSQKVTESSNALDLEPGVFTWDDPHQIALSLKRSAERSQRRKAEPFRSAMSMLTFYVNRAGTKLSATQRERLEMAKDELREFYGKPRRQPLAEERKGAPEEAIAFPPQITIVLSPYKQ